MRCHQDCDVTTTSEVGVQFASIGYGKDSEIQLAELKQQIALGFMRVENSKEDEEAR